MPHIQSGFLNILGPEHTGSCLIENNLASPAEHNVEMVLSESGKSLKDGRPSGMVPGDATPHGQGQEGLACRLAWFGLAALEILMTLLGLGTAAKPNQALLGSSACLSFLCILSGLSSCQSGGSLECDWGERSRVNNRPL